MKRALVTGASRGIGRAVTEMLLAEGWDVIGISRKDPYRYGIVGIAYDGFTWREADVSQPHQVMRVAKLTGPLDAAIHCAGIRGPHGPLVENDPIDWVSTIRTNLLGAYHVSRATLPLLQQSNDGRLLLFSGGGAFNASPGYSAYAVSKAGVVSLMETLAAEMISTSVAINCVAPGFVATHIHDGTPDEGRSDGGAMANVLDCVRHLLSPQTRGLTGKSIAAQHDDWASLSALTVDAVNASPMGTRTRHKLQLVANLAAYRTKKVV